MAEPTQPASPPLREVQIEALVVMRIIKHSTSAFPTPATGCLVGMEISSPAGTQLQITNSFPYPASVPDQPTPTDSYHQPDPATLAAAAPRAKSNVAYQNEMIKYLREVNVDAQSVGWYISTSMGNFVNQNFVENQFFFQRAADERMVALVFDVSRSSAGSLNLKAYRLSPSFMASYREGKFSTERYVYLMTIHSHPVELTMYSQHSKIQPPLPRYSHRAPHSNPQLAPLDNLTARPTRPTTIKIRSGLPNIPRSALPRPKHNLNTSST